MLSPAVTEITRAESPSVAKNETTDERTEYGLAATAGYSTFGLAPKPSASALSGLVLFDSPHAAHHTAIARAKTKRAKLREVTDEPRPVGGSIRGDGGLMVVRHSSIDATTLAPSVLKTAHFYHYE